MNEPNGNKPIDNEDFAVQAKEAFDDSVERLDAAALSRLNQGRHAALEQLATLREPVDAFFDAVMVMDEDQNLRENRLALLNQMRKLFLHTADLSRLAA